MLKKIALTSLAAYFFIGMCSNYVSTGNELYPFFSWNLFSYVPNTGHTTVLEILSYAGTTYNPPLPSDKNAFLFQSVRQTPIDYKPLITELGSALKSHDARAVADDRKKLERIFLTSPARYQIVEVSYDPLIRWNTGAFQSRNILGVFTSGQ